MGMFYPRKAYEKDVGGSAVMSCAVSTKGALHDCVVLSEDPPNVGFGQAALRLAPYFLMRPGTVNGKPAESSIRIPINFDHSRHREVTVSHLEWIEAPTYAQVVAAYPARAREAGLGGHVVLKCELSDTSRPTSCNDVAEQPLGEGFARAAKALSDDFRGPLTDSNGTSLRGDTIQISFVFDPHMLAKGQPVIGKPQWKRLPEALDMAASFPAGATAAHVSVGHVALACEIGDGGRLTGCAATRQDPEGLGFDRAALALAPSFQVSVWTDDGLPTVGGRVTVPIRYEAAPPAGKPAS